MFLFEGMYSVWSPTALLFPAAVRSLAYRNPREAGYMSFPLIYFHETLGCFDCNDDDDDVLLEMFYGADFVPEN